MSASSSAAVSRSISPSLDNSSPHTVHRRYSQPPLPLPLPGLGLRAALLGYLGEVEASIRNRLGGNSDLALGEDGALGLGGIDDSSASEGISEDHFSDIDTEGAGPSSRTNELRYRGAAGPSTLTQPQSYSSQDALLSHLSWLREDILASLPASVFSAPSSSREWLAALPARLMAVERGLWAEGSSALAGAPGAAILEGAVGSAREKVLEMVKGVLPTDEWEGWERLGWEDTVSTGSARPPLSRLGATSPSGEEGEEEEEIGESNLLFPNRTPAAKQAIASRRRTIRSKSLGAMGMAGGRLGSWAELQGTERPIGGWEEVVMPKLQRMRTMPTLHQTSTVSDDDDNDEDIGLKGRKKFVEEVLSDNPIEMEEVLSGSPISKKGKLGRTDQTLGPSIAEALVASDDGRRLMKYENLPIDWRNNEHIVTGYRFIPLHATTGPIPLLKSAFQWHNETINIHSHFIPSIFLMLVIPFIINKSPLPDAHSLDTAVIVLYLIAAISCLFTSAEWHVLSGCASKKWMEWGACVDYVGISWLIAASFGTVVYNAFYCQPKAVLLYCLTNAACGALGSYLPFQRWFNQRRMKPYRIAFFLFLNFAMFAPISQLFWKYGWTKGSAFTSPFIPSIATYFFGLLFYAFHFPECVFPGKFDGIGHSHQIWHAGIVVAIVLHYNAVFQVHGMRYEYSCALPGAGPPVSAVVATWLKGVLGR